MLMPDVNVLVAAFRQDADKHDLAESWLTRAVNGPESVALTPAVISGTLRIMTHPKIFREPTPIADAVALVDDLLQASGVVVIGPGPQHWAILKDLCQGSISGNLVSDAAHAAVAIEHHATWITFDGDFARFPVSWRIPD